EDRNDPFPPGGPGRSGVPVAPPTAPDLPTLDARTTLPLPPTAAHAPPILSSFLQYAAQVVNWAACFSAAKTSFAWTHRRTRWWVRTQDGRPLSPRPRSSGCQDETSIEIVLRNGRRLRLPPTGSLRVIAQVAAGRNAGGRRRGSRSPR